MQQKMQMMKMVETGLQNTKFTKSPYIAKNKSIISIK